MAAVLDEFSGLAGLAGMPRAATPVDALDSSADSGDIAVDDAAIVLGGGQAAFEAVSGVSFRAAAASFVCVLGPSGCGKSTLLGALAGHLPLARGTVRIDGAAVRGPGPDRGLVFQHHTLFPWKTVLDNVSFGLKMRGVPADERRARARELLALVGLEGFEGRYPSQLSGGMQQRVEIARVLINRPGVLLMDEPFGALDALTRVKMQQLLLQVWSRIRTTVVFVTHDIDEALFLADRILVMSPRPGRIIEDLVLPFGRPRHAGLLTEDRFVTLKRHCLALLHADAARGDALPRLSPLGGGIAAERWQFAV